jgi:hypothetical protein
VGEINLAAVRIDLEIVDSRGGAGGRIVEEDGQRRRIAGQQIRDIALEDAVVARKVAVGDELFAVHAVEDHVAWSKEALSNRGRGGIVERALIDLHELGAGHAAIVGRVAIHSPQGIAPARAGGPELNFGPSVRSRHDGFPPQYDPQASRSQPDVVMSGGLQKVISRALQRFSRYSQNLRADSAESTLRNVDHVKWKTPWRHEHCIDSDYIPRAHVMRKQSFGGAHDSPQPIVVERERRFRLGGARLDLDKGEDPAATRDQVDFADRGAGAHC